MRFRCVALCWLVLVAAVGCTAAADPEQLPTRAYTPVPMPTPTLTPFSIPAEAYYEEGLARQRTGDLEGALQSYAWAIELQPDLAEVYVARGGVYLAQGLHQRALAEANKALELDPESGAAAVLRGEALRLLGRAQLALAAFDQAVDLDPSLKADTFRSRWLAARAVHDSERLLALSREYAGLNSGDSLRFYYRGWALIEADQPIPATEVLIKAIASTPDAPALLWFALGQAYMASSAWPEAITCFEAARTLVEAGDASLALHTEQPVVDLLGMLGRAYLAAGRCVDAAAMLEYVGQIEGSPSSYSAFLEPAYICQTPTPLPTPYPTTTPSRP